MTISEVLDMYKGEYEEFEIYITDFNHYHGFHGDFNQALDDDSDALLYHEFKKINYELMDEEDYNHTIYANSSMDADFKEWFDNEHAKILCIQLDGYEYAEFKGYVKIKEALFRKPPRKVKGKEKYRIYYCYSDKENKDEGRYTTLGDAKDYCFRTPKCYVYWEDFDTREQAIEYLNLNPGKIWW